jgi:hypothetical protein
MTIGDNNDPEYVKITIIVEDSESRTTITVPQATRPAWNIDRDIIRTEDGQIQEFTQTVVLEFMPISPEGQNWAQKRVEEFQ